MFSLINNLLSGALGGILVYGLDSFWDKRPLFTCKVKVKSASESILTLTNIGDRTACNLEIDGTIEQYHNKTTYPLFGLDENKKSKPVSIAMAGPKNPISIKMQTPHAYQIREKFKVNIKIKYQAVYFLFISLSNTHEEIFTLDAFLNDHTDSAILYT